MDQVTKKLYELKAKILHAVAHPIRLAVVEYLKDGEQCVCDIAQHIGAQRSNVSRHLAVMVQAGVLDYRKDGLRMMYSLKTPCVVDFLSCVSSVLREQMESTKAILRKL